MRKVSMKAKTKTNTKTKTKTKRQRQERASEDSGTARPACPQLEENDEKGQNEEKFWQK